MIPVTVCPCCGGSGAQRVAAFRSRVGEAEVEYHDVAVRCPGCHGAGIVAAPSLTQPADASRMN